MPVSKSRNKTALEKDTQPVRRYATEKLLKSSHLKEYQPDFARVILTEPEYSVEEARAALDAVLGRGNAGHGKKQL